MPDIEMPQLGETVTEGTITKWFKEVGEHVDEDEVLFEVSTDKVDSEVPSPVSGTLTEILVPEGDTVEVGARLAVVDGAGGSAASAEPAAETASADAPPDEGERAPAPEPSPAADETQAAPPAEAPAPQAPPPAPAPRPAQSPQPASSEGAPTPQVASPLVRRLASDNGLDLAQVTPSGAGGRVTRADVERALDGGGARTTTPAPSRPAPAAAPASAAPATITRPGEPEVAVPLSNIRRRTGEHMVQSKQVAPHAMTAVEVDYEAVERVRRAYGEQFRQEEGFTLTYLPFIARAVVDALHEFPHVNATVGDGELILHNYVNLAIAVDLDFEGLLAPVIRDADQKRMRAIAREIRDLADRARSKQLSADEIVGGTFTLTNAGSYGTHMVIPVINQPQVAILSTDGVSRKPVVVTDDQGAESIAIHSTGLLPLAWDHRAFDGAYSAAFLARVREILETRDWAAEL